MVQAQLIYRQTLDYYTYYTNSILTHFTFLGPINKISKYLPMYDFTFWKSNGAGAGVPILVF